jgi:hypothetical protein
MSGPSQPSILAQLEYSHRPPVFDLSGTCSFDALLKVRRANRDPDTRPLRISTDASGLDPAYALSNDLFELVDAETGERVSPAVQRGTEAAKLAVYDLETRATRESRLGKKFTFDATIPIKIGLHFSGLLISGRKYTLRPTENSFSLHNWTYDVHNDRPEAQPDHPAIVYMRGKATFRVVDGLPTSPRLSVRLAIEPPLIHRSLASQAPPASSKGTEEHDESPGTQMPILRINLINRGPTPITLKGVAEQPCIREYEPVPGPSPHRTIAATNPSLDNFHIHRLGSDPNSQESEGEDCVHVSNAFVNYVARGGFPRSMFLTLHPNEPVERTVPFMVGARGIVRRMGEDGQFVLRLRESKLWWYDGVLDDLAEGDRVKALPQKAVLPLIPEAENDVTFRMEE